MIESESESGNGGTWQGVIVAEVFEVFAVSRGSTIGGGDSVERSVLVTQPSQSNPNHHSRRNPNGEHGCGKGAETIDLVQSESDSDLGLVRCFTPMLFELYRHRSYHPNIRMVCHDSRRFRLF